VAISSRKRPLLETLAQEMTKANSSAKAVVVPGDLSNKEEAKRVVAEAAAALGGDLDVLVLNHIRPYMDAFEDMDDNLIQSVIDVNFVSYIFLTKEALPMLRRSRGTLVAISSVAGQIPVPYVALYSGLKHALHGFYDSLRSELVKLYGDPRVSITTCVIGVIATESQLEISKGMLDDFKRETPENAAAAIVTHAAAGTHTMVSSRRGGWLPLKPDASFANGSFVPSLLLSRSSSLGISVRFRFLAHLSCRPSACVCFLPPSLCSAPRLPSLICLILSRIL
jgi:short-subunit dehydrogenase